MLFTIILGVACGPKMPTAQSMSIVPSSSVYLRNSFDMDPSSYIGRFVTDGEKSLDEASGMAMSCSQYISSRFVEGGGVRYNEILNVSTSVGARIGVPLIGSAKGKYGSTGVVRVQYELTGKMLSEVNDPEKFRQCCTENPDQCTRRYIGEFMQGKGVVFTEYTQGVDAGGSAVDPGSGVEGDVSFSHGKNWRRGIEFPNPVYFAFKINQTPYGELKKCSSWMSRVPQSEKGQYFVGISSAFEDENKARKDAQKKARDTAMQAGFLTYDSGQVTMVPEDWCMETSYQGGVTKYKAKALVLFSQAEQPKPPAPILPTPQIVESGTENAPNPTQQPVAGSSNQTEFLSLLSHLKSLNFDSEMLQEIKMSAGFPLTCAQVSQLVSDFKFSDDKMKAIKVLKMHITDPENYMVLDSGFPFSSDKQKLRNLFR